jgi:predicted CxxxxCH...CXXCH cytochrome family protein
VTAARTLAQVSAVWALAVVAPACTTRTVPARGPTYEDVGPLLEARCASCHGDTRAEGGYRVGSYVEATACAASDPESPVVRPPDARAPLVAALDRDDHRDLLSATERALVLAWVEAGAPAREGRVHPGGWVDPRSESFHGDALRAEGWTRMLEPDGAASCARCHAGAERTPDPETPRGTAPGATACTSCHTDEGGPFACSTCHGAFGPGVTSRAHPPRDTCRHPEERERGGAHAAHLEAGLACTVCHGTRDVDGLTTPASSGHGDGQVDVELDPARAGEGAMADHRDGTCTTSCHERGGDRTAPRWFLDEDLGCGSCHASPPADHYEGTCDRCHAEANAEGTALTPLPGGALHANGRVDLGDGSGTCGACHGEGDDPRPDQGAHGAHASPALAAPMGCAECHTVPETADAPGHLDRVPGAEVTFGARAAARGATPTFEGTSCREVACHGAGLGGGTHVTPDWYGTDGAAARCGACHGAPPPAPHPESEGCSALTCHGGYVTGAGGVSELGRTVHTDGVVDLWRDR